MSTATNCLKEFFISSGQDISERFICFNCQFDLNKAKKNGKIFRKHLKLIKTNEGKKKFNNLFFEEISDERLVSLLGINKIEFLEIYETTNSNEWRASVSYKNCLGFFLARLRLGLSIQKLLALIPIATYSRFLDNVRTNLDQFFENNSKLARFLYCLSGLCF